MTLKGAIADLQNLIDSEGIPFWAKPSLQKVKETIEEELQKEEKTEHDNKNDVIVVQIDCLMPMQNVIAFRKDLLKQTEDGIIVIPPWAHVSHVGDECKIEIKEMEEQNNG